MSYRLKNYSLLLAALLQVLPIVRNFFISPAATSTFAVILRWGVGTAATVGAYDACSGATNFFTGSSNLVGTTGILFTNNLTIKSSQGDGGALCTITTNGIAAAVLNDGQSTTSGMPPGLVFKFFDPNNGANGSLYCSISGIPITPGTNLFHVDLSRSGNTTVPGDFSIKILSGNTPPAISGQPAKKTLKIGTNVSFTVTAGGATPLFYFWQKDSNPLTDTGNLSGSGTATLTVSNITSDNAGSYSVIVSNSLGTATSSNATLVVLVPPSIATPPADTNVLAGNIATFTVGADGSTPMNFIWRKNGGRLTNGGKIFGANTATLTLTNVALTDTANYSVSVSNSVGSVTSAPALLTVLAPPSITLQPTNRSGALNSTLTLSVAVSGTAPILYQWFKGGNPLADSGNIFGANSNVLAIATLSTNDAGIYSVGITNDYGSVTSSNAAVSVNALPVITTQPSSQDVVRSNTVLLSVDTTGSTPMKFQWRKNGANIAGANLASLTLTNVTTNSSGGYSIFITNQFGRATSAVATVRVFVSPVFTLQASNRAVKIGSNTVFRTAVSGTAPISYQWFKDDLALTDGGNISGAFSNVLTVAHLGTNDAGNYFLTATNFAGGAASSNAALAVLLPPTIITQPETLAVIVSNSATFTVSADGTAPIRFQWRKAGAAISGATNATYFIPLAKTNDSGLYSVLVTNRAGGVVSSNALLTVFVAPKFTLQATNRAVKIGSNTVFRTAVSGTAPLAYQWFKDDVALENSGNISGAFSNVLTVAHLGTNDAGNYFLTVTNLAGTAASTNASLAVLLPPVILAQPESLSVIVSNPATFTVSAEGTAPIRFQWRKAGAAIAGATNATFTIALAKTNDTALYSVLVTNRAGGMISSNVQLTVFVSPVFTLQASNRAANKSSTTVFRAAVKGTAPLAYQWFKDDIALTNGGNISGAFSNALTIIQVSTNDAGSYFLAVTNFAGGSASSNASLFVVLPPTITAQPEPLRVVVSNSAAFTIAATGTDPIKFQWRKAGANIAGATNATFTIPAARTNDSALYSVLVTNRAGGVISSNVQLTVFVMPRFVLQASNRVAKIGSNSVFRATVAGTAPIAYQWFKNDIALTNGGNISGAFSNVLVMTGVSTNDVGAYVLAATNFAGGITSSNAVLSLNLAARIANFVSLPGPLEFTEFLRNPDGTFTLTAQCGANEACTLEFSADLETWSELITRNANSDGVWQFTVPAALPAQFFRLMSAR